MNSTWLSIVWAFLHFQLPLSSHSPYTSGSGMLNDFSWILLFLNRCGFTVSRELKEDYFHYNVALLQTAAH